jgi:hypothetical protein
MFKFGIPYKTDKLTHHGYNRFYDMFLVPLINKEITFFEIGVDASRSLKMWNDMFKNGKIYGMDINLEFKHPKGEVYKGDQSNKKDLKRVTKLIKSADVIMDDGSHVPEHQLISFNYLFNKLLKHGGTYIIEDIETSYWVDSELYGYKVKSGLDKENNIVKIFKDIVDIVNREFLTDENKKKVLKSPIKSKNLKYISSITFGGNCIIIKKMTENEYTRYGNRKYRWIEKLN